jgi:ATP synthase protein I
MQKWQASFRIIGLGWFVGLAILLGVLGGIWLDNKLGTRPLFIIIGLLLGIAVAIYGAVKMLLPLANDNDRGNG